MEKQRGIREEMHGKEFNSTSLILYASLSLPLPPSPSPSLPPSLPPSPSLPLQIAIVNANYMAARLKEHYDILFRGSNGKPHLSIIIIIIIIIMY